MANLALPCIALRCLGQIADRRHANIFLSLPLSPIAGSCGGAWSGDHVPGGVAALDQNAKASKEEASEEEASDEEASEEEVSEEEVKGGKANDEAGKHKRNRAVICTVPLRSCMSVVL